jgi:hypothetical protein
MYLKRKSINIYLYMKSKKKLKKKAPLFQSDPRKRIFLRILVTSPNGVATANAEPHVCMGIEKNDQRHKVCEAPLGYMIREATRRLKKSC